MLSGDAEEAAQHLGGLFGILFREKVAGVEPVAFNIIAPGLPKRDQSGLRYVPGIERPLRPPHGQERAHDPTTARAIRFVMLTVDRRGGAVFLADSVGMVGISERLHIGGTNLRREHSGGKSPLPECTIDNGFGNRRQDALWERLRLRSNDQGQ